MKRAAGVKDFGNLFPGHGGMTDHLIAILVWLSLHTSTFSTSWDPKSYNNNFRRGASSR